jgi:hypothetical protein
MKWNALGLLLLACSSEDPVPTKAEFCEQWADRACADSVVSACQAADKDACKLGQQGFCQSIVPDSFSEDGIKGCLDAVGAAYADADLTGDELRVVLKLGGACGKLIVGPSGGGESCSSDLDCNGSDGFECVIKGGRSKGTCQVPEEVGAGKRCEALQQTCQSGFYCDGSNCIETKLEGEECTINEECGPEGTCVDAECVPRLGVDSVCTQDDQCFSDLCYEFDDERTCTDRIRLSRSEPICEDLR